MQEVQPYSKLAPIYDHVMSYIDYEIWIQFLHELCEAHNIHPENTLDISCGTGNTIPYMLPWCGDLYCMDLSLEMVKQISGKFPAMTGHVWVGDMSVLPVRTKFDLIINLQDSMNYYQDLSRVIEHLNEVFTHLSDEGAYIFDFSTPENVKNNFIDLHEIYEDDSFGYERLNRYFPRKKINQTDFIIWEKQQGKKKQYIEKHVQRMYSLDEIEMSLHESSFDSWVWYEDEILHPPSSETERVHVVAFHKSA